MGYNKTIYKKDTKEKLRFLTIEANAGYLRQHSGIVGTSNPIMHEKLCKGKNIGRSNETKPEEQAIKEAEALYKDKLTKGYFDTIEEAESEVVILPQLAKDYKKESHKINWQTDKVYIQRKYDGMRLLAFCKSDGSVRLMSREGKEVTTLKHIERELSTLKLDVILDGEAYSNPEDDFQTNMSYIKEYKAGLTEQINFNIYDLIADAPYDIRKININKIFNKIKSDKSYLRQVETEEITCEEHLKLYHTKFLEEGYEGTMVRISKSGYKINGRSSELLKYKDFQDIACKIVDIGPAKQRPTWARPVVEYNGKQFACGLKMSHTAREEMLTNKEDYIGKIAEVRIFEFTNDGLGRFPVVVGIRLDKHEPDEK